MSIAKFSMDVQCGIWSTEYTLRVYGNKKAVLTVPYTKWQNNSGMLDFQKVKTSNTRKIALLRRMFENDIMEDADQNTLVELVDSMTACR